MRRLTRPRPRRVLRLIGWNALILFVLVALAGGGAELYFRLTTPFREQERTLRLAPGVGLIHAPHSEVRHTNWRDFWQTTRANSLGFLDREPPSPRRAAESCHVTLLGDSFVNASQVSIRDKAQVQLEELAALEAPGLDLTTSAFGISGIGQISQLAFYDAHARNLSPNVVVLVFVRNDFLDNSLLVSALRRGFHPDHPPYLYARRGADGEMEFVPPASGLGELEANNLPRQPAPRANLGSRIEWKLREWSYFADWAWIRAGHGGRGFVAPRTPPAQRRAWVELLRRDPRHAALLEGWSYPNAGDELALEPERNQTPMVRGCAGRERGSPWSSSASGRSATAPRWSSSPATPCSARNRPGSPCCATWSPKSGMGTFPSSTSTTTSSARAARAGRDAGRTTFTGTPPAIAGRRKPSSNG